MSGDAPVYRLVVAYLGAPFSGWQRQPNARTVQAVMEGALGSLLGRAVTVVGASRTDAGVHARGQAAHLVLERAVPLRALVFGTNRFLPPEVRVLSAARMRDGFHAQRSARAKEYRYRLSRATVLSPFESPFVVAVAPGLDLAAMRTASESLLGRHDFSAFARTGGAHTDPRRTVLEAGWQEQGEELVFRIVGDGFLRGMVRALVGTLLEVGRGRRAPESVAALLDGQARSAAGPTAPAHGLALERVLYDPCWGPLESSDTSSL